LGLRDPPNGCLSLSNLCTVWHLVHVVGVGSKREQARTGAGSLVGSKLQVWVRFDPTNGESGQWNLPWQSPNFHRSVWAALWTPEDKNWPLVKGIWAFEVCAVALACLVASRSLLEPGVVGTGVTQSTTSSTKPLHEQFDQCSPPNVPVDTLCPGIEVVSGPKLQRH